MRRVLKKSGILDESLKIKKQGDNLYIPICEFDEKIDELNDIDYEVVRKDFERRSSPTSPSDILGREPSFEIIGNIALLEKNETLEAGEAILRSDNNIRSVYRVASPVEGERRVRDLEYIAGKKDTETVYREYGREFLLDLSEVYFSPRLANERQRVIEKIDEGEKVFDMFAGVGPYTVGAAKKRAKVIATDKNPDAYYYLRQNIKRNKIEGRAKIYNEDARKLAKKISGVDRLIMDYPQGAEKFLSAAVRAVGKKAILHYYDIKPEKDFKNSVSEVKKALQHKNFEAELIEIVKVRSYAPGVYNICIDINLKRLS